MYWTFFILYLLVAIICANWLVRDDENLQNETRLIYVGGSFICFIISLFWFAIVFWKLGGFILDKLESLDLFKKS